MPDSKNHSIHTVAVHAGYDPQAGVGTPSVPPLVPSVGFTQPTMQQAEAALGFAGVTAQQPRDYIYARHGGPTEVAFEQAVAALEGADQALSFSSGMAALHAAFLTTLAPGDTILAAEEVYGVTRGLLLWLAENMQIPVKFASFLDVATIQGLIADIKPTVVFCEALTNPLVRVVRVDRIAAVAHEHGATMIVDNTFATPYLLRPLEVGTDIVVHSTTKFLNGHGDVTGGVLAGPVDLVATAFGYRKLLGATWNAFDAWLALRGLRTFAIRMQQSIKNAEELAHWLNTQSGIKQVYYPGLPTDGSYNDALALFGDQGAGNMIAFEIDGVDRAGAFAFVERLKLIRPVTSLGDVFSLILHPATSSHRALTPEQRADQGIFEGTLRLSVGIEAVIDLQTDISQALGEP